MHATLSQIPRYTLYALLIFTPLAKASVQGWAVTTIHLLTLIALTAFLIEKSVTWNWKWIKTPLDTPLLILIILSILSTIFSMHQYTSIWSVTLLFNYVIIFYLTINTIRTRTQLRQLIHIIIGVAAFLSIFGLFKLSGANSFPWWNYNYKYSRLTATYSDPNHLAGYLEMSIPLLLGFLLTGIRRAKIVIMIFLMLFMFLAIFLSLSRGAWLGLGAGITFITIFLMLYSRFKKRYILVTIGCGFFVLACMALSSTQVIERIHTLEQKDNIDGIKSRMKRWPENIDMIKDHPFLGSGPGTYAIILTQYHQPGYEKRKPYAHNDYLQFTVEMGLPFVFIFIWFIIALFKSGFSKIKGISRLVSGITLAALSGITAILVHAFGDFNLNIPANAILFTVLAALVAAPEPIYNYPASEVGERQRSEV